MHRWLALMLLAAPTMLASAQDTAPVFVSGQEGYQAFRIPSLIVAKNGDLLAFCEGRKKSLSDTGDIDLVLKRSRDNGKTWGPLEVVWDDGTNTCGNPCPVVDRPNGTIWLLLTHNLGTDKESDIIARKSKGTRTVWVTSSTDHGATWAKPTDITASTKRENWSWYATGPGCGIQLKSGRLVIPCDHRADDPPKLFSHVIFSDDGGKTWQIGGVAGPDCNECEVVEREDGSLLLNMRNYDKQHRARAIATSTDEGKTWSKVSHDATLIEPVCQASIRRFTDTKTGGKNRVLFSNPADAKARRNMTLRMSYDDAATWPISKVLHAGPAAYSCIAILPNREMGVLYESGAKSPYERIVITRLTLDALTNGKDSLSQK